MCIPGAEAGARARTASADGESSNVGSRLAGRGNAVAAAVAAACNDIGAAPNAAVVNVKVGAAKFRPAAVADGAAVGCFGTMRTPHKMRRRIKEL